MATEKTEYSKLEHMSVIIFSLAEKCKPCEIYRSNLNVYGETYFSQKMFTNGLNRGLPQRTWVEKTDYGVEALTIH